MKLLSIGKSDKPTKKMRAVFETDSGRTKTINFGQAGAPDYTITKDKEQRARYLTRHQRNEDWNNPATAGSLSRHILWGTYSNRADNIRAYRSKFNL
jgi:CRISPR/Cas system-associated endonuclease Cas1